MSLRRLIALVPLVAVAAVQALVVACGPPKVGPIVSAPAPTFVHPTPLDDAPKEEPRLVPAEVYLRTYLQLFGGLAPLDVQKRARGADGAQLFDTWDDYFASLGFPDHRLDLPRGRETNALMVATFERIGVALCDRAVEHDLKGVAFVDAPKDPKAPRAPAQRPPIAERVVFAFEAGDPQTVAEFAPGFDVLHRTFLGYPARLAETDRTSRFFTLYGEVKKLHAGKKSRFSPPEAGWASVCHGLVRHPELHLY